MSNKRLRLQDEFELSPYTMAIIPVQYGSRLYSKVLEMEGEIMSPFQPIDIIKKSCRFYASSFSGRKEGTKALIGVTHKAPIVIDPIQSIYFFPTASPKRPNCIWISHEHVYNYTRIGRMETEVTFQNKKSIVIPISFSSFETQMLRTALLRTKIQQRFYESETKMRLLTQQRYHLEAMESKRSYQVGDSPLNF